MTKHLTLLLLILGTSLFNFGQGTDTIPTIKRVSVEPTVNSSGAVKIEWGKTEFGQDSNYILNRKKGGTVQGGGEVYRGLDTSALDQQAYANEGPVGYVVIVEFPGTYPVNQPSVTHTTIYLETPIYDTCGEYWPTITLNWSPYVGWDNVSYEVFYKEKNSTAPFLGIPVGESSAIIDVKGDMKTGTRYEFYVMATNQDSKSLKSKSNIQEVFTYVPDPITANPTVINRVNNDGTNTQIEFSIEHTNPDAIIYELQTSSAENFIANSTIQKDTLINQSKGTFTTPTGGNFYRIVTKNKCNKDPQPSNQIKPLILSYKKDDVTLVFNWNASFVQETEHYQLFENGSAISDLNTTETEINIENYPSNQEYVYYIKSETMDGKVSISNQVLFRKLPKVDMPDAFTPNGDRVNDYIKPIIDPPINDYLFVVYNHYGTTIYEMTLSEIAKVGWDGTYKGKKVTEGAYPYYYRIVTDKGDVIENRGLIEVVYP